MLGAVTEVMAAGYLAPLEQKRSFPSKSVLGLARFVRFARFVRSLWPDHPDTTPSDPSI